MNRLGMISIHQSENLEECNHILDFFRPHININPQRDELYRIL